MPLDVLAELRKLGRSYPAKAPPIPVVMTNLGQIGHIENRRQLYINSAIERHVYNIIRDQERAELAAREISDGKFGADDLLPIAALGTDSRDAIRAIKSMRGAIAAFDDIINARASGKVWDFLGTKASSPPTTNIWSSVIRGAGIPAAASYSAIPGPAAFDSTTVGAWPLPVTLGAGEDLYLTSFGTSYPEATSNVILAVDILTANGSISSTIVTSQNVNSTAITRWTGGAGVLMVLEVTNAFGTATGIPAVRVNYTDQSGNANSDTGNITIGATNQTARALLPTLAPPIIPLASGDFGVRSVEQVTFSISSATAGGACALLQYKPLVAVPTFGATIFVERSTPASLPGIIKLTSVPAGSLPFIGFFCWATTSNNIALQLFLETVYG